MEDDDGDQMEMTEPELQKWIREKVEKSELMDPEVLKKCHLLQSLLKRREKQAATFLKLCESVAECEAVIKKLYCLIGWEYTDAESDDERLSQTPNSAINIDDDGDVMDCDNLPQSTYEAAPTKTPDPGSKNANSPAPKSKQRQKRTHDADKGQKPPKEEGSSSLKLMKDAVVVLTRLPACKIRSALNPRVPPQYSSDEDLSSCGSDTQWEPKNDSRDSSDSNDSDCSNYSSGMKSHKRRGMHQKTRKLTKNHKAKAAVPQAKAVANMNAKNSRTAPRRNTTEADQRTKTSETNKTAPSQRNTSAAKEAATKQTETAQKLSIEQSCALVVSSLSQALPDQTTQPPTDLPELEIKVNMMVLARRRALRWEPGKIVEIMTKENGKVKYKVDFEGKARGLVSGHHIAFDRVPALQRLYIGARVVAKYDRGNQPRFYSGVLGEMPSRKNRMRFLIFFDDQKPLYVGLPCLYLVCRPLKDVSEDIADSSHREFIKEYLKVWPYPPLTQYRVGQTINTEYKGAQRKCEVLEVDCSLIQIVFQDDQHKEWIYRGSVRLEHIANMKKQMDEDVEKRKPESETTDKGSAQQSVDTSKCQAASTSTSTTTEQAVISKANQQDVTYTPHQCCPACIDPIRPSDGIKEHRGQNPLLVPLRYKFRRMKATKRGSDQRSPHVYYRTPCGLCLCSMAAVEDYLYLTHCDFLYLEMFCLDPCVSVSATHKPLPSKIYIVDLAMGKENQQVSCINEFSNVRPPAVTYTSSRVAASGISINTSLDFMVGCDCRDGCRDSLVCSCRRLTVETTSLSSGGQMDIGTGYTHKRLNARIITGLYECNALCRCDQHMCSNRVVQHGIQLRLQVFMSPDRRWGVRCLDDIAKGTFVCTFSGMVLHDEENLHSNGHCAKLNLIEGVEIHKDNYESEADCSESETEPVKTATSKGKKPRVLPASKKKREKSYTAVTTRTTPTTRGYFDREECCYVLDAKKEGNLARYINHSCSPNLFEQNVFVDTHDLRFPWLAFFTNKHISAGTELTWDYRSGRSGGDGPPRALRCCCDSKKCCGKP